MIPRKGGHGGIDTEREINRIKDSGRIRLGAAGRWAPAGLRGKYQGIELDSIIVAFSD